MKKLLSLIFVFLFLGCQQQEYKPSFKYNKGNKEISFKIKDQYVNYNLDAAQFIQRADTYVQDAYTLEIVEPSQNLFIEMIEVYHDVTWNGQPRSLYENFLKETLKLDSLKVLLRKEVDKHYELTSYLVNDQYRLDMIYIFDMNRETMILDGSGKLFNSLGSKLLPSF